MLAASLLAASTLKAEAANPPAENVAVLEFAGGGLRSEVMEQLTEEVRMAAVEVLRGRYNVLNKTNQDAVLKSQGISLETCDLGGCEIDILRNLQAKYGITGNVVVTATRKRVTLQLYDVALGTLLGGERVVATSDDELIDETFKAATSLITKGIPSGPAKVGTIPGAGLKVASEAKQTGVTAADKPQDVDARFDSEPERASVSIDGEASSGGIQTHGAAPDGGRVSPIWTIGLAGGAVLTGAAAVTTWVFNEQQIANANAGYVAAKTRTEFTAAKGELSAASGLSGVLPFVAVGLGVVAAGAAGTSAYLWLAGPSPSEADAAPSLGTAGAR